MAGFQHAILTQYQDTVSRPVTEVLTNAIVLIGSAPTYQLDAANVTVNEPRQTLGDFDDARYAGSKTSGFTIPHALDAIRDNGGATVDIINVFDPAVHATTATQDYTFVNGKVQLKRTFGDVTINAEGLTGTTAVSGFLETDDYTLNPITGLITRVLTGAISANETVSVTYTYADPSKVTPAEIIGGVNADGERTGLQAAKDIYNLRGYRPKLLVIPLFNEEGGVAAEMDVIAEELKAYYFLDAPVGTTKEEAIAGRAGAQPVGTFSTASRRCILCMGRAIASDGTLQPLSQYCAGVIAGTDVEIGTFRSPSNRLIRGLKGVKPRLSGDYISTNTDIHALNAAGISTVFANAFGVGYRWWGNRSAMFPSDASPINFIPVGRTVDVVMESIQRASLPFLDRSISVALIDAILASVQAYILEKIQEGALIAGSEVTWNKQENLDSQLAAGQVMFSVVLMVPTPAEGITYSYSLDINLLSNILPTSEVAA